MIRSLWISKTGLDAQQTQIDVIANNLANVSTNGFKRSRAVFEDLLYQTLRQPGAQSTQQTQIPSGLQIGTGVRPVATERIFTQGNLQQTSNPLDVAIQGNGFFQVLMPDGTTAYTRDGSFQSDAQGQLVTSSGFHVQPAITIPPNTLSVTIARDGTVSALVPGAATPTQVGSIQLVSFINPAGLQSFGLYLVGAVIALILTMVKIPPLAFALGMYIPQELNVPLVFGGLVAWWVTSRSKNEKLNNARFSRGTLIASGFIAGGSLFGVLNAFLKFLDQQTPFGYAQWYMGSWAETHNAEIVGLIMFVLLFSYTLWDAMRAKEEE